MHNINQNQEITPNIKFYNEFILNAKERWIYAILAFFVLSIILFLEIQWY